MTSAPSKNANGSVVVKLNVPVPPSFKNRKRISINSKSGKQFLRTREDIKDRMQELTDALVSELLSVYRTTGGATSTACSLRSWIASSLPEDDSWNFVPNLQIEAVRTETPTLEITITEL